MNSELYILQIEQNAQSEILQIFLKFLNYAPNFAECYFRWNFHAL